MTPIETLLARLPGAKKAGNSWSARCPVHDDRHASLSVSTGDDGRVLLHCHAGCDTAAIVAALGLELRDLFPPKAGPTPARNGKPTGGGRTFATAEDAVAALERRHGKRSALWTYHDAQGEPVGLVVRWDKTGGKDIRPVARHSDGWRIGAMPEPRPLYGLPDLAAARRVIVCEGEKAADAARSLGFVATTSAGGSQAATKPDWGPLRNKEVVILPDHDAAGEKYANDVAQLATAAGAASVRILRLADHAPDLPYKGDLADVLSDERWCGLPLGDAAEPADLATLIEQLAQAVEPWRAAQQVPAAGGRWEPDITCMADVEPQKVPWLWYGRIPLGRLTLLVGRPGCGKSLVTCDLAARVSTHTHWPDPGFDRAPLGDTLLICAEDDPADTIRPRLDAAGANCRRVHLLKAAKILSDDGNERSVAFDLSNVDLIRDALDRLPDCKLVVVDPIGSYLGGQVDAHRDNEVRSVLAPLAALAAERGVAVVLVCHTRKALAPFADDMALGSRAFVGLARSVLHLMADPDDEKRKLLLPGKCNLSAPPPGLAFRIVGDPGRLEWEPDPLEGFRADDVVAPKESQETKRGPEPKTRDAASEWLADLLKDGPMPVADIREQAKAADLSWRTIRRAQESLGIVPRKKAFGGGWEWGLPEGGQHIAEGGQLPRRCPSSEKPGHLRENTGKIGQNSLDFTEGVQVSDNLATFGQNVDNLATFDDDATSFPFGWNNPSGQPTRRFKLSTPSTCLRNPRKNRGIRGFRRRRQL
jgi:putative DNA primase/helicase